MTKLHVMALAAAVAEWPKDIPWVVAYTVPENYGHMGKSGRTPGWRDVIVAPLADTAALKNEEQGRGLIVPGHESDRLIVALAEIEPSSGVILVADTPKRPDLRMLSERVNQKILRQLTRKRLGEWITNVVGLAAFSELAAVMGTQIRRASSEGAPILLFPFGPKSLIFSVALQLASKYPESSWFVYPIPFSYDLDYSDGIGQIVWLGPRSRGDDGGESARQLLLSENPTH